VIKLYVHLAIGTCINRVHDGIRRSTENHCIKRTQHTS